MTEKAGSPPLARARTIAYWVTTVLVAAELGVGGVGDILTIPYVRTVMDHLGYPVYFPLFMGAWKIPGAVALLVPRRPRLKEWVYAGFVFNMTGAIASHLAVGDGASAVIAPVVLLVLGATSWALRTPPRRL